MNIQELSNKNKETLNKTIQSLPKFYKFKVTESYSDISGNKFWEIIEKARKKNKNIEIEGVAVHIIINIDEVETDWGYGDITTDEKYSFEIYCLHKEDMEKIIKWLYKPENHHCVLLIDEVYKLPHIETKIW